MLIRLKSVVTNPTERTGGAELPYVALEHVEAGAGNLVRDAQLPEMSRDDTMRALPGDVLFGKLRPYLSKVLSVSTELQCSSELLVLRPDTSQLHPRYLYYLALSRGFTSWAVATSVGVKMPRTDWSELSTYRLPDLPPLDQQDGLASYLDGECSQLDSLIAEQHLQRGLLSELSHARQSGMVLKGLQDANLIDSGQWWMGAIPSHWEQVRLKFVARLESGHTPTRSRPELWEDCTIPWISLNDVGRLSESEFVTETVNLISDRGLAESSARVLPAGTVVLSRDATVGRCGVMAVPMATSQHFADWVCGPRLEPRYLWLLFRTAMQPYFDSLTAGSTLRTIGVPELRSFVVPLPPVDEQKKIVIAAEAVRRQAEELVAEMRQQEALLIERRQALITAAVTGQLEVA